MTDRPANARLASQASPYLRGAAHQPVAWHAWGADAFERAKKEDKPILLDIGAVWCHWCHVMDGESYDDADLATLINERFVAVKVDRDERPDVDVRYQKSVGAITGQGGWPLTAFLTPAGDVFYGGTYFPPVAKFGRPSFREVLTAVADAYHGRRTEIMEQAGHIAEHAGATRPTVDRTAVDEAWIARRIEDLGDHHDPVHGGWGAAPKFPHPSAVETLLAAYERRPDDRVRAILVATLDGMEAGGVHDHIGGGFHRYSVDAEWHVPHFEKMLYDNAELLRNYVHAYRILQEPRFAAAAHDVYAFLSGTLADVTKGGFFGSQDADVTFGDDGDFFTWTKDELDAAVGGDERLARLLSLRFGVEAKGPMHHNPAKNVLRVVAEVEAIAKVQARAVAEIEQDLVRGLALLRATRAKRKAPFIDPVLYTNWNGMATRAVLEYAAVLDVPSARVLALRALDRFLAEAYAPERGFRHTIGGQRVEGLLDDQTQMLPALIAGFHATQDAKYLRAAREVADLLLSEFWTPGTEGFVDVARSAREAATVEVLRRPIVPLQDSPSHSANARALEGLLLLSDLTGETKYGGVAADVMAGLAAETQRLGLFAAALVGVAQRIVDPPAKVVVAGPSRDARCRALVVAALESMPLSATLVVVDGTPVGIPAEAVAFATGPARDRPGALVCVGERCLAPAFDPAALRDRLTALR